MIWQRYIWFLLLLLTKLAYPQERLEIKQPITAEISGGATHLYQITLRDGECIEIEVVQKGIDLTAELRDSGSNPILEFDHESRKTGRETIEYVAGNGGGYQLPSVQY